MFCTSATEFCEAAWFTGFVACLVFFNCGFTLFLPLLKQLPIFLKNRYFQPSDFATSVTTSRPCLANYLLNLFIQFPTQHSTIYVASCIIHIVQKFLSSIIMAPKTQTLPHNDKVSTLPELHSLLLRPHPTPHQSLAWLNPVEKQ